MSRVVPIVLDVLAVLVFAFVGRLSHGLEIVGVLGTAWPFLLACLAAWAAIRVLGWPGVDARGAALIWATTLGGGIALRLLSGETAAPTFILVSAMFLGLALAGWRLIAFQLRRRAA